ncbi:MAG: PAS domain S-box protein [Bacteroidia bacterium]
MIYNKDRVVATGNEYIFKQLFHSLNEFALILTDTRGNILNWNKGAEKIFQHTEEEVKGQNISFIYKNADRKCLEKEMQTALSQKQYNFETIRVSNGNSPFIANVSVSPLFNEEQTHFGYSWIIKDLTILKLDNTSAYKLPEKLLKLNNELQEEIDLRIKIERALREKEKEQLDLLEHAPVGIIWTSSSDEIKMVNKTLLDLWFYDKEDLANKNISSLFLKKDEAEILLTDVKKGTLINNYKTLFLNKKGEKRNVSINTSAYSPDDQIIHTRWYIEDITERLIGEKAIEENERLGRILDDTSNEIYIFDLHTLKFLKVNKGALLNLGYNVEEVSELTPLDLIPEFSAEQIVSLLTPLKNGEKDFISFETFHKRKDGTLYPVDVRLQVNRSENTPVYVAIIQDVSERMRTQKELELMLEENKIARARAEQAAGKFILLARCNEILNSSMHYTTTLKNATKILIPSLADWLAIDLVDDQKNIYREVLQHSNTQLKDAAKNMMKYVPVKGVKNGPFEVIETGKSIILENIKKASIKKHAVDDEHQKLALQLGFKSCIMVPLKVRNNVMGCLTLVYAKKNYTAEELSLAEEIAHRMAVAIENARLFSQVQKLNIQLIKRAEELTASNSELERFAYVASHDLQEPLRVITSFLQLLDKKYGESLDDKAKEYIAYAVDGSMRMRQLIRDLLNYSRLDSGKNIRTEVDLNVVMSEVIDNLAASITDNNAVIRVEELPKVKANKAQMVQLFQNLVSNSIKYKSEEYHPQIMIKADSTEKYYRISVSDNGIGISPNYHSRIFDMFQRLHTRDEYSGTGIGLAICKKIIEHHRGFIEINSSEGKGAEFIINLPGI